ncbi:ArsR family transcriptional regulator [Streptomyces sp. NPDC048737]|uniref:ArsR family transcriptional regulator n=1 Tax=unclassified Streptomyces TaxID=2593676 RepID=UPI00343201C4
MPRTPASERRLRILERLKEPARHFPPQRRADLVEDGVTADSVVARLGVHRGPADSHLADLGLLRARRIGRRACYRRDEMRIAEVVRMFDKGW